MAEHLLAAVLLVFVGLVLSFLPGYGYRTRQEADPGGGGPVEAFLAERRETLRERFANGEVTRQQFAAEIERVENPETECMCTSPRRRRRRPAHRVHVVREFESLETLAAADRADLEAVNRVGETRARAIRQRALRTGRSRQIQVRLPEGRP